MADPTGAERQQHIVQIVTTEHFTLQTGRGITVAEANGRVGVYLSTVSTTLVALAFIGQMSHLGPAFYLFGLILFASVFFLGLFTFARCAGHAWNGVASGGAGTDTERHDGRKRGVVTRVIRYGGYAFVKPQCSDEQPDVFMHLSSLQGGFAWDDLEEGMTVLYRDRTDRQGRRVATAVWPLKADMPVVTH